MLNDRHQVHSTFNIQHSTFLVILLYALLALLVIPVFPHFPSPNEFSRWALAASIIDGGTLEVTRVAPLLGERAEDLSEVGGRIYSNKAPGAALIGLPGYAAARAVVGAPAAATMRITLTAMRLLASTVPTILLAMVFGWAAARLGATRTTTAVTALLFGTPLFAYGLLNFSHALTAFALFGAWVLLFVAPGAWRDVAAGALIGLAVVSEYPCAIAGAVLVAFAIRSRSVLRIVAGGIPFAAALALYNRAAFGSALALSSGHERYAPFQALASEGFFGVRFPSLITLAQILFSVTKGLFVFSPILALAVAMLPRARRAMTARQFWSLVITPLSLLVFYSGYPNWHGGWTVGVRYLVPALPFLALPLAFAAASWLESLLLGASVAACAVTTLVFPFVPPDFPLPWGSLALPLLARGLVAPNLLHLVARPLAITVPFALVCAALAIAAGKRVPAAIGAAAWLALGALAPLTPAMRIERAFIEQVYFEQPDAIAREAGAAIPVSPRLLTRAAALRKQPPTSWPF